MLLETGSQWNCSIPLQQPCPLGIPNAQHGVGEAVSDPVIYHHIDAVKNVKNSFTDLLFPSSIFMICMGVRRIFSRGANSGFSRVWSKTFSRGSGNSGEISFYQLESKKKHFSSEKLMGRFQNASLHPPSDTYDDLCELFAIC